MTSRVNESSGINSQSRSNARPHQETGSELSEEGCPVIEESGAVCGETRSLSIFQEFGKIVDDCLRRMEGNKEENMAMRKLTPFRNLVENLWEQNVMLVETVEELEKDATCKVSNLQRKLDDLCNKVAEKLQDMNGLVNAYMEDIDSLLEVIRRFRESGKVDSQGLKFNTIFDHEIHGINCKRYDSDSVSEFEACEAKQSPNASCAEVYCTQHFSFSENSACSDYRNESEGVKVRKCECKSPGSTNEDEKSILKYEKIKEFDKKMSDKAADKENLECLKAIFDPLAEKKKKTTWKSNESDLKSLQQKEVESEESYSEMINTKYQDHCRRININLNLISDGRYQKDCNCDCTSCGYYCNGG